MCRLRVLLCLLSLLLFPHLATSQSQFVNGGLVVVDKFNFCAPTTNSGTTYACDLDWTITEYNTGAYYAFKADIANTGSTTINFNSAGAKTIKKLAGNVTTDLVAGDLCANQMVVLLYDGTNMQMVSPVCTPTVVRSIFIPASYFEVSGSCTQNASAVLVSNGPKLPTVTCTDNDADGVEFDLKMPGNWNASTIQIELDAFSLGNNNTEVLELDWAGQCVRSGDTPAAHSTTGEQPTTITWGNAANREQFATSSAITLNGTCAAGAHLYIRGQVDATATTMSPMTDLKIVGVRLLYTTVGVDQ